MILAFFGTKLDTQSAFDDKGNRLVITNIKADPLTITQIKTKAKDGYWAIQCAQGKKSNKSLTQPLKKHLKKAKLNQSPRFLREIRLQQETKLKLGDQIKVTDVFQSGDKVKVTGTSKGRGFAGVIKRWGFAGGPRTHGQSDRRRAPGSIGQGTDPGRVWKGKKMPGHFGHATKSVTGLQIISFDSDKHLLIVAGTVPGPRNSLLKITKTGSVKKPIKLFSPQLTSSPKSTKSTKKTKTKTKTKTKSKKAAK